MTSIHPLYDKIIKDIVEQDQRDSMPDPGQRAANLRKAFVEQVTREQERSRELAEQLEEDSISFNDENLE